MRNAGLCQLPGRETGALQVRPRLVDPHMDGSFGVVGCLNHAESGPELAAGKGPGIAVRQEPQVAGADIGQDGKAGIGQSTVIIRGLGHDLLGLPAHGGGQVQAIRFHSVQGLESSHHAANRPAQIDRGRPGLVEAACRGLDELPADIGWRIPGKPGAEREAEGGNLPDGRRTPDRHVPDHARAVVAALDWQLDERAGQGALVDHEQDLIRFEAEWRAESGGIRDPGRPSRPIGGARDRWRHRGTYHVVAAQERLRFRSGLIADGSDHADNLGSVGNDVAGELPKESAPRRVRRGPAHGVVGPTAGLVSTGRHS